MSKNGFRESEDTKAKISHEISDCLWSIIVLAKELDIDLEETFNKNMDILAKRIEDKIKDI